MKGGCSEILVRGNRLENAGQRAVNIGGSIRPSLTSWTRPCSEAWGIVVEGNLFVGSLAPLAFVGVDGAVVLSSEALDAPHSPRDARGRICSLSERRLRVESPRLSVRGGSLRGESTSDPPPHPKRSNLLETPGTASTAPKQVVLFFLFLRSMASTAWNPLSSPL